jgi:heme-degrading monooxygenase HmoA
MNTNSTKNLPYYMALFIIELGDDLDNFEEMSLKMNELVSQQSGYLGGEDMETTDGRIISICYWENLDSIKDWRGNLEHQIAIKLGKEKWFKSYQIQISKVEYILGI